MRNLFVVIALLGLVACGNSDDGETTNTTTEVITTTTTVGAGATTSTSVYPTTDVSTPEDSEQGVLTKVAVGDHDGFVRVVFTFGNLVPGYAVKKAEPPFTQDGSGKEVEVAGDGHLAVRLTARAHDEEGKSTVSTQRIAGPRNTSLTEVVLTGDFEGIVSYVIGMTEAKGFKVFTLTSPPRLVIDIQSP